MINIFLIFTFSYLVFRDEGCLESIFHLFGLGFFSEWSISDRPRTKHPQADQRGICVSRHGPDMDPPAGLCQCMHDMHYLKCTTDITKPKDTLVYIYVSEISIITCHGHMISS